MHTAARSALRHASHKAVDRRKVNTGHRQGTRKEKKKKKNKGNLIFEEIPRMLNYMIEQERGWSDEKDFDTRST